MNQRKEIEWNSSLVSVSINEPSLARESELVNVIAHNTFPPSEINIQVELCKLPVTTVGRGPVMYFTVKCYI